MYYVVELGWGKRTNGSYESHCNAGVKALVDGSYLIYGMNYLKRDGKKWVPNPSTLWIWGNPGGKITGVLEKNRRVAVKHRSIDAIVNAVVISVYPATPPGRVTSHPVQ